MMYVQNKTNVKVGIPLNRKQAISFFDSTYRKNELWGFSHGTMTVELMLKDNPHVQIMGLEHNQYEEYWRIIQAKFTKNVARNQEMIDSTIAVNLNIWQGLVNYCREQNVKVGEINTLGFTLLQLQGWLKGVGLTETESKEITNQGFRRFVKGFQTIFASAPNTLFIIAAGNEGSDSAINPDINNQIILPNTMAIGALFKDLRKVSYSNYGRDVEVYAPAHFALVNSKDSHPESSGTSAASPVVCNLAIKLFCLNPNLSPKQVKNLIIDSSDKDLYELGINVINPKKAVELLKK